jgi:hypothetical protein
MKSTFKRALEFNLGITKSKVGQPFVEEFIEEG